MPRRFSEEEAAVEVGPFRLWGARRTRAQRMAPSPLVLRRVFQSPGILPRATGFGAGTRRTAAGAAAVPLRFDCWIPRGSRNGLLQDALLRKRGLEAHEPTDRGGNLTLVHVFVHHSAARHAGPDEQSEDFVGRTGAEMVLARHVCERVAVATAVGDDNDYGVAAIVGIGFNGLDNLPQPVIHDGNGARVMAQVAPMHVIAVLVIDHDEPGPQFLDGAYRQFSEQMVAARIHQTGIAVVLAPTPPEPFEFLSLAVFALGAIIHLFPFG